MRLPYSNNSQRRSLHRLVPPIYPDGYFRIAPFRIIDFKIYGLSVLLRHVPPSFKVVLMIVNTSPGIVILLSVSK